MRTRVIFLVVLAACAGDSAGPPDKKQPIPKMELVESSMSVTSKDWPTTRIKPCVRVEGITAPAVEWILGTEVLGTGTCAEISVLGGSSTITAREKKTGLTATLLVLATLEKPRFLTELRDSVVVRTSASGAVLSLQGSLSNGDSLSVRWSVGGVPVVSGGRFVYTLNASEQEVCKYHVADPSLKNCARFKVTLSGFTFEFYVANPEGFMGLDRPIPAGVKACMTWSNQSECWDIPTAGSLPVKPTFLDQVPASAKPRLWITGAGIQSMVMDLPYNELFGEMPIVLLVRDWRFTRGSFVGQTQRLSVAEVYEESSSPDGVRSLFLRRKDSNGVMHYELDTFGEGAEIKVYLAESTYKDPYMSVNGSGPFAEYAGADSVLVMKYLKELEVEYGGLVTLTLANGAGSHTCNSYVVYKRANYAGITSWPTSCNQSVMGAGGLTGGFLILGREVFEGNSASDDILNRETFHHEVGTHFVGAQGHSCTKKTVAHYLCSSDIVSRRLTAWDVAHIQAKYRVMEIARVRKAKYHIPEMLHAAQLEACPTCTIPAQYDLKY